MSRGYCLMTLQMSEKFFKWTTLTEVLCKGKIYPITPVVKDYNQRLFVALNQQNTQFP